MLCVRFKPPFCSLISIYSSVSVSTRREQPVLQIKYKLCSFNIKDGLICPKKLVPRNCVAIKGGRVLDTCKERLELLLVCLAHICMIEGETAELGREWFGVHVGC